MLNVSQSDYTLGNKIAQGFSISIHAQGESFNAFDEAFSVMPGTYATISLSEQRVGLVYVFLELMFFAFRRFNKIRKSGITLSWSQIFVSEISFLTCPNAVYLKMLTKLT